MIDHSAFFDHVRRTLFDGALSAGQRQRLALILDRGQKHLTGPGARPSLAYVLATAYHETGRTMQPIRERGGKAYLTRNYDVRGANPKRARANGNTAPGDGIRYAGRGFVQLTWRSNYRRIGDLLGIDLVESPDKALDPAIAALILVRGMQEGWFTGRKLADYFTDVGAQWVQARRIVNGLDRASLIAGYAQAFDTALQAKTPAGQALTAAAAARTRSAASSGEPLKSHSPSATNSAPVAASGFTMSGPAA
jgi:putative chitinase